MAVEVEIDVEVLKSEIKKTYASVSAEPEKDFIFPTGRSWAGDLDYPPELANVPDRAVESFAGVANPFTLGRLAPDERVLDLGSGAGTDSLVAAQMVGDQGHVTGISVSAGAASGSQASAARGMASAKRATPAAVSACRSSSSAQGGFEVVEVEQEAGPPTSTEIRTWS
jgi:SAM-dependent methyltransferase